MEVGEIHGLIERVTWEWASRVHVVHRPAGPNAKELARQTIRAIAVKCQHCEKPATFHITELTEPSGPVMLHLCEEHARVYLSQESVGAPQSTLGHVLAKQLKLDQTAEERAKLDKKTCPVCGISFAEFRQEGRLGCAYDYICFQDDLETLLLNIHGSKTHRGKRPSKNTGSPDKQHEIIQLRREMKEAIAKEQYERAGEIRDLIRELEQSPSDASAGQTENTEAED